VFPNAIALFSTTVMDATTCPPRFNFKFIIDGAVMLKLQKYGEFSKNGISPAIFFIGTIAN